MKGKLFGILAVILLGVLAFSVVANAAVEITSVEIDDDELSESGTNFIKAFERGEELPIKVHLTSDTAVDDVQIEAEIRGYDHDDLMEDITDVFDMKAGVSYTKKMSVVLSEKMDQDTYKLRIQVEDRDSDTVEKTYELEIDTSRHKIVIKDVVFSPEYEVQAGRALLSTVRLANMGEKDEEGIKVTVSIPALGLSASDYIDELEKEGDDDDETSSEELYLRIPTCAEAGEYNVKVQALYDDGEEIDTEVYTINVVEGDMCDTVAAATDGPQTVITIAQATQDIVAGEGGAVYPITLSNAGKTTKTYTLSVDGVSGWGEARLNPSNVVVLGEGETKAVYVYVAADENAVAGEKMFSVTVTESGETLEQLSFKANVQEGETSGLDKLKKGLQIGLVVLVVLLVILALIIGFNKLKGDDDEEEDDSTYY